MKLVFCGTPQFAVPTLEAILAAGHEVALVVTQPDRVAGRGMEMQAPPVKRTALERNLPVVQPEKIKSNVEFRVQLEGIAPDAIVVVAYGRIIPQWMLDLPRFGNINLHGSLLPKYRGAAPIQWAVANGEVVTGVTTMRLDSGLDTGDMLLAQVCPIALEETAVDVYECLADVGSKLMVKTLWRLEEGSIYPEPQNHELATLAPILKREDGWMDFGRSAKQLYDRWRGFQPWPGAHTSLRGKKLIAHKVRVADETFHGEPGEIVIRGELMMVRCADATMLAFDEVQLEGKKRMSAAEFLRGFQLKSGERLGQ
ncbi:methionyl-tRNA formyltransferase [Edaphobacter aggregans]|uniref:Methionyl-tRNA formyltransferase n=1 Tax=Edaphobacter aggregans TaxID=570835 RepID=A0A3R9WFK8_9BACT|nr:methionyl-tRNA formyltransferase [Edaphobacter aggregans]RSL15994.1 methionyl-tRNA formyltransferase [Edaphobacter aggregans]